MSYGRLSVLSTLAIYVLCCRAIPFAVRFPPRYLVASSPFYRFTLSGAGIWSTARATGRAYTGRRGNDTWTSNSAVKSGTGAGRPRSTSSRCRSRHPGSPARARPAPVDGRHELHDHRGRHPGPQRTAGGVLGQGPRCLARLIRGWGPAEASRYRRGMADDDVTAPADLALIPISEPTRPY